MLDSWLFWITVLYFSQTDGLALTAAIALGQKVLYCCVTCLVSEVRGKQCFFLAFSSSLFNTSWIQSLDLSIPVRQKCRNIILQNDRWRRKKDWFTTIACGGFFTVVIQTAIDLQNQAELLLHLFQWFKVCHKLVSFPFSCRL